jgi:hypothetical protein
VGDSGSGVEGEVDAGGEGGEEGGFVRDEAGIEEGVDGTGGSGREVCERLGDGGCVLCTGGSRGGGQDL